jgi:hypothetical protein
MGEKMAQRDRTVCRSQLRRTCSVEAGQNLRRADRRVEIRHRLVELDSWPAQDS